MELGTKCAKICPRENVAEGLMRENLAARICTFTVAGLPLRSCRTVGAPSVQGAFPTYIYIQIRYMVLLAGTWGQIRMTISMGLETGQIYVNSI